MVIRGKDNSIVFSGHIGKEPEIKTFKKQKQDGTEYESKVVRLGVIVDKILDENKEQKNIWLNVYAFGSILANIKKGDMVFMTGKVENDTFTGQDGAEHTTEKVRVEFVNVMPRFEQKQPQAVQTQMLDIDDDNLPF